MRSRMNTRSLVDGAMTMTMVVATQGRRRARPAPVLIAFDRPGGGGCPRRQRYTSARLPPTAHRTSCHRADRRDGHVGASVLHLRPTALRGACAVSGSSPAPCQAGGLSRWLRWCVITCGCRRSASSLPSSAVHLSASAPSFSFSWPLGRGWRLGALAASRRALRTPASPLRSRHPSIARWRMGSGFRPHKTRRCPPDATDLAETRALPPGA